VKGERGAAQKRNLQKLQRDLRRKKGKISKAYVCIVRRRFRPLGESFDQKMRSAGVLPSIQDCRGTCASAGGEGFHKKEGQIRCLIGSDFRLRWGDFTKYQGREKHLTTRGKKMGKLEKKLVAAKTATCEEKRRFE